MSSKFVIFNWKMNPLSLNEGYVLVDAINQGLNAKSDANVIACPSFVHLDSLNKKRKELKSNFGLGCQDISVAEKGAYTGQIAGNMLVDFDVEYAIIGHSETRELWNYKNVDVNQKVKISLENSITPILCIGFEESEVESDQINYAELKEQIEKAFKNISDQLLDQKEVFVAYEPVWAIGSGKTATKEIVSEVTQFIKNTTAEISNLKNSNLKILYGGSVNESNISDLSTVANLDGFLVGGASLVPEKVIGMIEKS